MPEPCLALLTPQGEVNSRQEEAEGDECAVWMFLPELNFCSRPCGGLIRLEEKQPAKPTHSPQENFILSLPMATEENIHVYITAQMQAGKTTCKCKLQSVYMKENFSSACK